MGRITEATAPCSVELLGGPEGSSSFRLVVALDRRVWCRVAHEVAGLSVRSKDTLRKLEARSLQDLPASARGDAVVRALEAAGVTRDAAVETHVKVPEDSGLATGAALSVALVAACLPADEALPARIAAIVERAVGEGMRFALPVDVEAALHGGAHVRPNGEPVRGLALDPARLEECLLLVDAGPPPPAQETGLDEATGAGVLEALERGQYAEVGGLLARARSQAPPADDPAADRIRGLVQEAGGAAWRCRGGRIMTVWAAPGTRGTGPREEAIGRLQKAGLKPFPARVDARGLEVD